jgi:hypothetical protein
MMNDFGKLMLASKGSPKKGAPRTANSFQERLSQRYVVVMMFFVDGRKTLFDFD